MPWHPLRRSFLQIVGAACAVAICGTVRGLIDVPILPYLFFVPGIMAAAFFFGRFAGAVSVVLSALTAIYFFLPPDRGFVIQNAVQALSIALFTVITLAISLVTAQLRRSMLAQAALNRTLENRIMTAVAENERINEALRQSQKMEAIGQLSGGIAHDFNNILMGVSGSLDLLRSSVERGRYDRLSRYIDTAEQSAKRAADLTHRLLAFSRKQTLEPRQVDAFDLVNGMIEMLQRTLGPTIDLRLGDAGKSYPTVRVDPVQLESAILNLCLNSRDAMPNGGTIMITIVGSKLDLTLARENDLAEGDYVTISVTDTGTGIPADIVSNIFEPFFTTKPKGNGTGLGLAMVYGFARQSGGQAVCQSTEGGGTTMRIILPLDRMVQVARPIEVVSTMPSARGELILVVDDEPAIRAILEEALNDAGYRVLMAHGGQEAIECLRSTDTIDLVLTDVGMPVSGRIVADKARELYPTIPILFITGFAAEGLLPPGYLDDGKGVVTKPFAINGLLQRVAEMVRH